MANPEANKVAALLRGKLGAEKVLAHGKEPSDMGTYGTGFYWMEQAAKVVPICRVLPTSTADIVKVLEVSHETQCPFAVKSGGCATYAEAANIEGGITIDLSRFKEITISQDRKTVMVSTGCRWGEVYSKLDKVGLAIVGGRISSVGVGGLTLGGGISFFSSRKGLACDNIRTFEVVLASGEVIQATRDSHPDLFWALRGAGRNFGIVTRFEFETFEQGQMWGGARQYTSEHENSLLASLDKFNRTCADEYAEAFFISAYVSQMGDYVETAVLAYGKPEEDPPAFDDFKACPHIASSTRPLFLTEFTNDIEQANPSGFRFKTTAQAIKSDLATMKEVMSIFKEEIEPHKALDGFLPALLFQPLRPAMLPKDSIGNALGLVPEDGPLFVVALLWRWIAADHDKAILGAVARFLKRVEAASLARGTFHRYVYLNYGAPEQDIYGGYGERNKKRLLEISNKYDPKEIFSRLRPGYINWSV